LRGLSRCGAVGAPLQHRHREELEPCTDMARALMPDDDSPQASMKTQGTDPISLLTNVFPPEEWDSVIARISKIVCACSPVSILTGFRSPTFTESPDETNYAAAEYLHHLVLVLPPHPVQRSATYEDVSELGHLVARLLVSVTRERSRRSDGSASGGHLYRQLTHNSLLVRGKSYVPHQCAVFDQLLTNVEAWFARELGLEKDQVIGTITGLLKQMVSKWRAMAEAGRSQGICTPDGVAAFAIERNAFLAECLPDYSAELFQRLSARPGSQQRPSSLIPGSKRATSRDYPILEVNGHYYLFQFQCLVDELPRLLSDWVQRHNARFFNRTYVKVRERSMTEVAVRSIQAALPRSESGHSLYYPIADGERAETDAIIVFDDVVLVIESKAGALSYRAARGDTDRVERDFASLVNEAFVQASRTVAYIRENDRAVFEDQRGNEILVVNGNLIRRVYLVNVVRDAMDPFAVALAEARRKGLLSDEITDWPWTVFINDLQIVTGLLDTPAQFLTYLEHRQRFNEQLEWMFMQDEMDLLHYFLKTGFLLEREEFGPMAMVSWQADMNDFNQYFEAPALGEDPGPKPELQMPPVTMSLVRGCEKSRVQGRMRVAVRLMTVDKAHQREIQHFLPTAMERVASRGRPQRCQFFVGGEGLSCWFCDRWDLEIAENLRFDDRILKYDRKAGKWTTAIFVLSDEGPILQDIGRHHYPWRPNAEMETISAAARQERLAERSPAQRVGRNNPCPCGSGKKFKKCCGR
jgi:hypothetical protein